MLVSYREELRYKDIEWNGFGNNSESECENNPQKSIWYWHK